MVRGAGPPLARAGGMEEERRRVEREDVDPADALGAAALPLPEGQPRGFVPEQAPGPSGEDAVQPDEGGRDDETPASP